MCKDRLDNGFHGLLSENSGAVEGCPAVHGSPVSPQAVKDFLEDEDLGRPVVSKLDEITGTVGGHATIHNPQNTEAPSKARNEGFARLLKKGTARSHRAAENVHFVRDFMQHKVSAESYKELLGALFHVYSTLEEELDRCSKLDSRVKAIHFPFLARRAALLQDMQYFHGDNREAFATALYNPSPAAKQYVDRLREIGKSKPLLLVAHSYTRYLGDLSGGQILAKAATKAFNLPKDSGISFYHFKALPDAHIFKNEYRAALDGLRISQEESDDLVHEANLAFIHNMRLFQERDVAAGYITAVQSIEDAMVVVNEAKSALSFQKRYAELGGKPAALAQCPFLPKQRDSAPQELQPGAPECPMRQFLRFVMFVRQMGVKCDWKSMFLGSICKWESMFLGSLLIGTALQRSYALRKLA